MEAHHYLVREFDRAEYSCVLLSGFAIRHKIVAGGQRQIIAIHMKGEMDDLQNSLLRRAGHSVQMLTAGKVAMIPRDEIKRLAFERPSVGGPCGRTRLWTHPSTGNGSQTLDAEMRGRRFRTCYVSSRWD